MKRNALGYNSKALKTPAKLQILRARLAVGRNFEADDASPCFS
jgi:hypothetical protein